MLVKQKCVAKLLHWIEKGEGVWLKVWSRVYSCNGILVVTPRLTKVCFTGQKRAHVCHLY